MLSFSMLHQVRKLAAIMRFHWEKRKVAALTKTATATQPEFTELELADDAIF